MIERFFSVLTVSPMTMSDKTENLSRQEVSRRGFVQMVDARMLRMATNDDKEAIINVLRKDIRSNAYLYIDIVKYGLDNEFVKVWVNSKGYGELKQIVLQYYNTMQLYVQGGELTGIIDLIVERRPDMISGRADVIRQIHSDVRELYTVTYGFVLSQVSKVDSGVGSPELATEEDMEEIACLICSDKGIGGHYKPEDLKNQLVRRLRDNIGRNYVIRDKERIVAHYATYAEAPGIAVTGGLIVAPEYRGNGYAKKLHCFLSSVLLGEGRDVVFFCHDHDVLGFYLRLGASIHDKYGKLTLISD